MGAAVEAFAATGLARASAFRLSLDALLALQVLAFAWFLVPVRPGASFGWCACGVSVVNASRLNRR